MAGAKIDASKRIKEKVEKSLLGFVAKHTLFYGIKLYVLLPSLIYFAANLKTVCGMI